MSRELQRELEILKEMMLHLDASVEKAVALAVRAIEEKDPVTARQVMDSDFAIDQEEVKIEEAAMSILALHQPVASDLRLIVAAIKINTDLERIGDLAVNIAERAEYLATQEFSAGGFDFKGMSELVMGMLRKSMDAFVRMDLEMARAVCASDDAVDAMNRAMYDRVKEGISRGRRAGNIMVHLLSVSRHLERIADHATNIAEEVVFLITGEIVRHKHEDYVHQADGPSAEEER